MLDLQVLDDAAQLTAEFREQWAQLHDTLPHATPFQRPEWLVTWWQHFGSGTIQILAFRTERGQLTAVIPCFLHEWQGLSQLTLIGSGISDYLDPLILRDVAPDVLRILSAYLQENQDWRVCSWQDLSSPSPLADLRFGADAKVVIEPDAVCSVIPLPDDFDTYWKDRPSGLRRNVRRYTQKASELAEIHFEQVKRASGEQLDALLALHTRRWREQGEPGMVKANRSGDFLRQVCQLFASNDGVIFFSLRFQEEIAAIILAFPHREQIFAYLSAFDPAYNALGFGRILLYHSLQFASQAGYRSWNFLRGKEPYKADWGAVPLAKVRVTARRAPGLCN